MHYLVKQVLDLLALSADLEEGRHGESAEAAEHRHRAQTSINEAGTHLLRYASARGWMNIEKGDEEAGE